MIAALAGPSRRTRETIRTTVTSGTVYSGALALDAYTPSQPNRPAVVVVHGGGWSGGSRSDTLTAGTATMLAALGFGVFSISYTLDPADPQTPITNVMSAMTYVRANAAANNIDSARVYLLGISAGGHLGLLAGIQGVAGGTRPDAIVAWSPPCELGALTGDGATYAAAFMNTAYAGNEAAWQAKSPRQAMSSNCCRIRLVGSASEVEATGGIAQSQINNLVTAAQGAGVTVAQTTYAGAVHADFLGQAGACDVNAASAWLQGL